jgi:peptidyl-prolyl cis-trans isomerase D
VKTDVVEQERLKEIAAYSGKIVDRLKAGETTFEALAKELGANVDKTKPLTRTATPPGLTQSAVLQAFALPKGGAGSAATADGKARTIIRVADVIPAPPATSEQTEHLKTELTRQLQGDILSEYVSGLQKRYGLTVNQELLKQALGTEREQPDFE